jgi:protein phosphatase
VIDTRWYVGTSDGNVAIYQGVPADIFGFQLSHVVEQSEISAAEAEALPIWAGLEDGINVDSREEAESKLDQIRRDIRQANRAGAGG